MPPVQKLKKRNGTIVDFNPEKIATAVQKAFLDVLAAPHTEDAKAIADSVSEKVSTDYGGTANIPSVETIQDLVEHAIMERGYFEVVKSYIIYRYEHAKIREEKKEEVVKKIEERGLLIVKRDGTREIFSLDKIKKTIEASLLVAGSIDIEVFLTQVQREVYDGITTVELEKTMIMVARAMIELDPAYNDLAAGLTLSVLYKEVFRAR